MHALKQWAFCLKRKYPEISDYTEESLIENRKDAFCIAKEECAEPTFRQAMEKMYNSLPELQNVDINSFIMIAESLDLSVEYGCQYPNYLLLAQLLDFKKKGKKIICVSDYYHDSNILRRFLKNCNIDDGLFDNLYVSCEHEKSKAKGTLYEHVMFCEGIKNPKNVLMIGDNKHSDQDQAKKVNLTVRLERHLVHKGIIRVKEKYRNNYHQIKSVANYCYKKGVPFSEYITLFYEFISLLAKELVSDDVKRVSFMAREGYYLQLLYKEYCKLCIPDGEQIISNYFRCSRRSVFSGISEDQRNDEAIEPISIRNWIKSIDIPITELQKYMSFTDEEMDQVMPLKDNPAYMRLRANAEFEYLYNNIINDNKQAFLEYVKPFLDRGIMNIVDSGWKGTIQAALFNYYNIPSTGYYIGTQDYSRCPEGATRKGLVFSEGDGKYYDYVGMNFPFYQELLAAPHGSAIKYYYASDGIKVKEEWESLERSLYIKRIESLQNYMMTQFMGLCAWNDGISSENEWIIAKTIFHSNMFTFGERYNFAQDCENSFFVNFQQEKKGAKNYDYKQVSLGLDLITKPEKYIRYITKIQRSKLYNKKIVRIMYPALARCFYYYTLLIHCLKGCSR